MIKNVNRRISIFKDAKRGWYRKYFISYFMFYTLIFSPMFLFASTYNTITDAGNGYGQTWDNTNEQFSRSDSQVLKLTWDADEVFIEVTGNNEHFIYFSGSSGTTSGKPWDITPTLPFSAQYVAVIEPWDGGANSGYSYNGSNWNTAISVTYIAHHNDDKSKTVKINTSALGSQSSIKWCAFAKTNDSDSWVGGYVPSNASTSGNPSSTDSEVLTRFYAYGSSVWLQSSQNPNSTDYSLPVELTSFTATPLKGAIELNWATESEIDNLGFLIDRSLDPISGFTTIADYRFIPELQGQGSVTSRTNYSYTDTEVIPGTKYYYILSDVTGNPEHGEPVTRHTDKTVSATPKWRDESSALIKGFKIFMAYPNPFNPKTVIAYELEDARELSISIVDINGRLVTKLYSGFQVSGFHELTWQPQDISAGIYFCRLTSDGNTITRKIVLLK